MNFWHMQLHPGDSSAISLDDVYKFLKVGNVGMGRAWENDRGQPILFSDAAKVGDVIMIRHNGPVALVMITSNTSPNLNGDHWFEIVRSVKVLSLDGESTKQKYKLETGRSWSENLYNPATFQSADKSEFIRYWYSLVRGKFMLDQLATLLMSHKNLVLTGAPGTGKTYLAFEVAKSIANTQDTKSDRISFVQFHPSYDYSDFVEGLKPTLQNGQVAFEIKAGVFKTFCKKAQLDAKNKYVFIIDEINRADLSRVFGELFFGLEESYRGEPIVTQYAYLNSDADSHLVIPKNLYLIGTMNDVDRSVESLDFALRRRFAWKEIDADYSQVILDGSNLPLDWKIATKQCMSRLNGKIESVFGSKAFQIGGAYFKKLEHYKEAETVVVALQYLWVNHLEILLQEYLRGMNGSAGLLQELKSAYEQ